MEILQKVVAFSEYMNFNTQKGQGINKTKRSVEISWKSQKYENRTRIQFHRDSAPISFKPKTGGWNVMEGLNMIEDSDDNGD